MTSGELLKYRERVAYDPILPQPEMPRALGLTKPAPLQDGLRDIIAPSSRALSGVARAHPVAAVIEQLASEERV
jgi:hypothetical protein